MNKIFIHSTSIVETEKIVNGTKIWAFSHVSQNVIIGDNCVIGEGVHIGPNVVIGDNCKIQNHSLLYEGVTLEDNVFLGPNTVTTNDFIPQVGGDWKNSDRFKKTLLFILISYNKMSNISPPTISRVFTNNINIFV